MKVTTNGKKVVIEMTAKQLNSLRAIFDSFVDQVDETSEAYGDSVRSVTKLREAIAVDRSKKEKGKK